MEFKRLPPIGQKTRTSDGWGTVSFPVGRRHRWGTKKKLSSSWVVHRAIQVERTKQMQQVRLRYAEIASQQVSGRRLHMRSRYLAGRQRGWTIDKSPLLRVWLFLALAA